MLNAYFKRRQLVNLIKLIDVIALLFFPQHSWAEISQAHDVSPFYSDGFPIRNSFL